MRFSLAPEVQLFAESLRAALQGWEAPREPELGAWQDDRDDALAERLAALGWGELWTEPALLAPAVAGAIELGRVVAPLSLLDEATLGAPLAVDGRVRHGRSLAAAPRPGGGLAVGAVSGGEPEPTLDGTGTRRDVKVEAGEPVRDAGARWAAWGAVSLGYAAGLAGAALDAAVSHASSREQFGASLAALPAVQARLADAAVLAEGLELSARAAASDEADGLPSASLGWAGPACREVTAHVVQVHGAIGFALESGIHRFYRRAESLQVWGEAVLAATATQRQEPLAFGC